MEVATLEAPAPVHTEPTALVIPQPTVAEILDQHLDHAQQKKIAVETLSKISFDFGRRQKRGLSRRTEK